MPKRNDIFLALGLLLPMLIFYGGYLFNHDASLRPTGFIQYDNVSYVAYAKQYLDAGQPSILYSNPFNEQAYPPVYFQPQTLFFALLLKLGVSPGQILIPFSILSAFLVFLSLIRLYDQILPGSRNRTLHLWLMSWGGGLFVLCGVALYFITGNQGPFFYDVFEWDPNHGWWGLNWGRALLFSCEAYYHAVFIGAILALVNRRWGIALILVFLLSLSHPFTGIELIGVTGAFACWEIMRDRRQLPLWFVLGILAALAFHLAFYLFFLERAPDHYSVSRQYALNWRVSFRSLPAYALVGALAWASIRREGLRTFFSRQSNRLFAAWFLVAFALINHEWLITPRQPVHFTRGYVWMPLFLMGLPALHRLTVRLTQKKKYVLLGGLCLVFLLDNLTWVGNNTRSRHTESSALFVRQTEREVLDVLKKEASNRSLIVSSNTDLAYLSAVYTDAWPWFSHPFTTPFAARKQQAQEQFFATGAWPPEWSGRDLFVVLRSEEHALADRLLKNGRLILQNRDYRVVQVKP